MTQNQSVTSGTLLSIWRWVGVRACCEVIGLVPVRSSRGSLRGRQDSRAGPASARADVTVMCRV